MKTFLAIVIITLVVACGGLYLLYKDQTKETKIAQQELELAMTKIEEWKVQFEVLSRAQEQSEETIKKLQEKNAQTEEELLEWKNKYGETDKRLATVTKKIRKLERENEKVRNLLSMPVPIELWREIFPNSTKGRCNDEGGAVYTAEITHATHP